MKNLLCAIFLWSAAFISADDAMNSASEQLPSFYERVKENVISSLANNSTSNSLLRVKASSESNLVEFSFAGNEDSPLRLANIGSFLPFRAQTSPTPGIQNDAVAILLAMYHFNSYLDIYRSQGTTSTAHPILESIQGLDPSCSIRLVTDFFDTNLDPVQSTELLSQSLRRDLKPTSIIGGYHSGIAMPLAILSSVSDVPYVRKSRFYLHLSLIHHHRHFSASATSNGFDNEEQFPLFSRTSPSSTSDARAVVAYLQNQLNATHVAILFVTDAFGSTMQKEFQDIAKESGIQTKSAPFRYYRTSSQEIGQAIAVVKSTGFRYIFVVCVNKDYQEVMKHAVEAEMVGPDYFWLFYGIDLTTFRETAASASEDSPIRRYSVGSGIITQGAIASVKAVEYEDNGNPYSVFQKGWIDAMADASLREYFDLKLPANVSRDFSALPNLQGAYLYDTVFVMGTAMCRVASNFFPGQNITQALELVALDGASGQVAFTQSHSRDASTAAYTLWNIQFSDGPTPVRLMPTSKFEFGAWSRIEGASFVYASNSTDAPSELPPIVGNNTVVGPVAVTVALTVMGFTLLVCLFCIGWTIVNRNEPVICATQPSFLLLVGVGAVVMSCSVIPLSLRSFSSGASLDASCMAPFWVFLMGFSLSITPLVLKAYRLHEILTNPEFDRLLLSFQDFARWFCCIGGVNVLLLLLWSTVAPWTWIYTEGTSTDMFDRKNSLKGSCGSSSSIPSTPFTVSLLIFNVGILVISNWWSYRAMALETEYDENLYISYTLGACLEVFVIGLPLLTLLNKEPGPIFFVSSGFCILVSVGILLLLFFPKIRFLRQDKDRTREESKRRLYATTRANNGHSQREMSEPVVAPRSSSMLKSNNEVFFQDSMKSGFDTGSSMSLGVRVTRHPVDDDGSERAVSFQRGQSANNLVRGASNRVLNGSGNLRGNSDEKTPSD